MNDFFLEFLQKLAENRKENQEDGIADAKEEGARGIQPRTA